MSIIRQTELMETNLGNLGSKSITGTSAVVPASGYVFSYLYVAEAAVVAAQVDAGIDNADLTAITSLPVGIYIYGKWSSITLTSGSLIGYYGT